VTDEIVRRIEREAGVPGLSGLLASMPGADLRSLLWDSLAFPPLALYAPPRSPATAASRHAAGDAA